MNVQLEHFFESGGTNIDDKVALSDTKEGLEGDLKGDLVSDLDAVTNVCFQQILSTRFSFL
jgi:hypothetical protein